MTSETTRSTHARLNIRKTGEALGRFLRDRGHRTAGYWLGEHAAAAISLPSDHYTREEAASALVLGHSVTLDVNYRSDLDNCQPSYTVRLRDGHTIELVGSDG